MHFSAVALGHKLTAVLVAAAVGGGVYSWFRHNAVENASSAELSFDMHAARRIDAGFVQAHEPAVAFAQSILTDQKIADLSKAAYLSTSAMMSRVGEFRSRLELTQPTGQELRVQFRDPDPTKAAATANTVANALTAWAPSPDGPALLTEPAPPAQPAATQPAMTQPAAARPTPARKAPVPAPAEKKPETARQDSGLAAALGALEEQLSSTSQQVEQVDSGGSARHGYEGRAYAESEQQRLLKTQVRAAETKVEGLRTQATGSDRERLGTIQHALASILSGGGVGVSASRLRRERDDLASAIGVVEQQRQAIDKEQSAAGAASAAQTPAAPGQDTGSTAQAPASSGSGSGSRAITESSLPGTASPAAGSQGTGAQTQPAPTASTPESPDAAMLDPLHLVRLAGQAAPPVWWPAAAAGVLCGLLYWLIAAARQPRYEDFESAAEVSPSYARFITPDEPVASVAAPVAAPEPESVPGPFERGPQRRASFMYEPSPEEMGTSSERGSAAEGEDPGFVPGPAVVSDGQATSLFEEKVVEMDPWTDLVHKAMSETEIGRMFESSAANRAGGVKKDDEARRPVRPDRLAG